MASDPDGSQFIHPFLQALSNTQDGGWFIQLIILLLLILLGSLFSAAEAAIISLPDNKLKKLAENGHKQASRIVRMTKSSERFLAMLRTGMTLIGCLAAAVAAVYYSIPLAKVLFNLLPGFPISILIAFSILIVILLFSIVFLIFADMVPKKLAVNRMERTAFMLSGPLNFFSVLLTPLILLISSISTLIFRLFGVDTSVTQETVTEEEILMLVDAGEEKGVIKETAKDMIEGIFDFDDTLVNEVMTHRTDVTALECTETLHDAVELAISSGFSRIPVYDEDIDTILGILYVKDLLKYVGSRINPEITIKSIIRPALFVPEGKKCSELFTEMTENRTQIAVIVDEYGGTEGIVTMEDLVESIVGNIQDEYDNEEEEISQLSENSFTLEGTADIDEVSDLTGVEFPEGDYDTIAGYIVSRLGRIPKEGEHPKLELGNVSLSVEKVEDRRISRILLVKNKVEA